MGATLNSLLWQSERSVEDYRSVDSSLVGSTLARHAPPALRGLLLPLIDSEVAVAERIVRADAFLNTRVANHEAAVAALLHTEDPWLTSCGAYAIGKLGLKTFGAALERLSRDTDPLLQKQLAHAQAMLGS